MAARSLLPTDTELATFDHIDRVVHWVGLERGVWDAFDATLGGRTTLRLIATLPIGTLHTATSRTRIPATATLPERELYAVEIIQVALVWRAARKVFGLPDVDPLVEDPTVARPVTSNTEAPTAKKVKMSSAVDQLDESEVSLLSTADVDQAYRNYREAVGADPLPESDPTVEQITAMHAKVLVRQEAPYADFSVLTPYGRRMQKQSKARNFLLQQDGSWKSVEIPGPPSFQAWCACWKIYKTVLLMLKHPENTALGRPSIPVTTVAALEEYFNRVSDLHEEFPEAWHLVMQAEDRCRGEQFDRIHRELTRARAEGRLPMSLDFDPFRPWVGVMQYAARCQEYWDRTVIRPAQTFLARGGASSASGRQMTQKEAEESQVSNAASAAMHRAPGEGTSKTAKRRQRDKAKIERLREDNRRPGCRALEKEAQVRHRVETVMVIPGEQVESSRLIVKEIRSASPLRKDQSDLAVSLVHNRGRIAASFALAPIQTPNASRRAVERGRARRATRSDRRMIPCLCKKLERGKMHG